MRCLLLLLATLALADTTADDREKVKDLLLQRATMIINLQQLNAKISDEMLALRSKCKANEILNENSLHCEEAKKDPSQ